MPEHSALEKRLINLVRWQGDPTLCCESPAVLGLCSTCQQINHDRMELVTVLIPVCQTLLGKPASLHAMFHRSCTLPWSRFTHAEHPQDALRQVIAQQSWIIMHAVRHMYAPLCNTIAAITSHLSVSYGCLSA